jgi:copper homeostasis protein CutC
VLTSGHCKTALEGVSVLSDHIKKSSGKIKILAGGTVRAENIEPLVKQSGVH